MFLCMLVADVQVTVREDGVGVPVFLNEPWTITDQRIVVNISEEMTGLIVKLVAINSITQEAVTTFRKVAGDPSNLFTVNING